MHNLYAIFAKILEINKKNVINLVDKRGNIPRRGVIPRFSDIEVISLNMAAESIGIDSENTRWRNKISAYLIPLIG